MKVQVSFNVTTLDGLEPDDSILRVCSIDIKPVPGFVIQNIGVDTHGLFDIISTGIPYSTLGDPGASPQDP